MRLDGRGAGTADARSTDEPLYILAAPMRTYVALTIALVALFLGLFAASEAVGLSVLTDPDPWLSRGGLVAAGLGVGLLVGDVLLPVPSSLIMVAHGRLFGVLLGAALSLAGSLGAAWLGFLIGRCGSSTLARRLTTAEHRRADALVRRWGSLAVLVTRPVPIVAETVAVIAGTSSMGWGSLTLFAALGALPASVLYALAGAVSARLGDALLVFALVLVLATIPWVIGRRGALEAESRA